MKRMLALALVFALLIPAGLSAADSDMGLTTAITAVKQVTDIPEELDKFEYSSNEYDGTTVWELRWYDSARERETIFVSVTGDGQILDYNRYSYSNEENNGLSFISLEEAKSAAKDFLSKVLPDLVGEMKIFQESDIALSSMGNTFRITFCQYVNDVPVIDRMSTVAVNKFTKTVTNYSGFLYQKDQAFEPAENAIGLDAAKAAYLKEIGVKLYYNSHYDYKTGKLTVFPVYAPENYNRKAISAIDGSVIDLQDGPMPYPAAAKQENSNTAMDLASGGGRGLSPVEQAAVSNIEALMSKEDAVKAFQSKVEGIPSDLTIRDARLYKNTIEKTQYIWNFTLTQGEEYYCSASVDAASGVVLSFDIQRGDEKVEKISKEDAKAKAEDLLETLAKDRFGSTVYSENNSTEADTKKDEYPNSYYFQYIRTVNGIEYPGNYLSVTYDNQSGRITGFHTTWNDNAQFPLVEGVLSKEVIMDQISESASYGLLYKNGKLLYQFFDTDCMTFDPFKGTPVRYDGSPYIKTVLPSYKDIEGHWCADIVQKLLENGMYKNGDTFAPDETITQSEFFRFVMNYSVSLSDEDMYERLIRDKYLTASQKNPAGSVTRTQAAKVFVKLMGYDELAQKPEIFINPFKDDLSNTEKGYAAICYAFGIIKGDTEGNFNGSAAITNAETAAMLYNYLSR